MLSIERAGKALMVTRFQFGKMSFDIRYQQDMVIRLYCAFIIPPLVPIDLPDAPAGPESFVKKRMTILIYRPGKGRHSWLMTYSQSLTVR